MKQNKKFLKSSGALALLLTGVLFAAHVSVASAGIYHLYALQPAGSGQITGAPSLAGSGPMSAYLNGVTSIGEPANTGGWKGAVLRPSVGAGNIAVGSTSYLDVVAPPGSSVYGIAWQGSTYAGSNGWRYGAYGLSSLGWTRYWGNNAAATESLTVKAGYSLKGFSSSTGLLRMQLQCTEQLGCPRKSSSSPTTAGAYLTFSHLDVTFEEDASPSIRASGNLFTEPGASRVVRGTLSGSVGGLDEQSGIHRFYWSVDSKPQANAYASCSPYLAVPCPKGSWFDNSASLDTRTLSDGWHSIWSAVYDYAGNNNSASRSVLVDNTAPSIAFSAANRSLVGSGSRDFAFSVSDLTAVSSKCRFDSGAWSACSDRAQSGLLADGEHAFSVESTDEAGNVSQRSFVFVVDSQPPMLGAWSGPHQGQALAASSAVFTWQANEPSVASCRLMRAGVLVRASAACDNSMSLTELSEGSYSFQLVLTDRAGNQSSSDFVFSVDLSAPQLQSVEGPQAGALVDGKAGRFSWVLSEDASVECRFDSGAWKACNGGVFAAESLTDGEHLFELLATDRAGNPFQFRRAFRVDATAPVFTEFAGISDRQWFAGRVSDVGWELSEDAQVRCRVDDEAWRACQSGFEGLLLADGGHRLQVEATDMVGNQAVKSVEFSVDTVAPRLTATAGPAAVSYLRALSFGWSVSESDVVFSCSLQGRPVDCGGLSLSVESEVGDGQSLVVVARDRAGNEGLVGWSFDVRVPAAPQLSRDGGGNIVWPPATGAARYECRVDGEGWSSCSGAYAVNAFAAGAHLFEARSVGGDGLMSVGSTLSFTVSSTGGGSGGGGSGGGGTGGGGTGGGGGSGGGGTGGGGDVPGGGGTPPKATSVIAYRPTKGSMKADKAGRIALMVRCPATTGCPAQYLSLKVGKLYQKLTLKSSAYNKSAVKRRFKLSAKVRKALRKSKSRKATVGSPSLAFKTLNLRIR